MSSLDKFKRVGIVVGIPSRGVWHDKFGMSLCAMMTYFMGNPMGFREEWMRPFNVKGSILPNQRLDIVKYARKIGASHILFVDTDQVYPKDTVHALMRHDKDVVACNIATKQIPAQPTARHFNPENLQSGTKVYNNPSKGLEKVWRVGCGVMLIRTSVFDKIGLNVFGNPWQESVQAYQGEDWSLVAACEAAEIDVWIDHQVSEQVRHIGDFEYDHNVVGEIPLEAVANG